jgi:hypothetical protein
MDYLISRLSCHQSWREHIPGRWDHTSSVAQISGIGQLMLFGVGKEILDRLSVQLRQLKQFHYIHAAVARLTFGKERMGQTQGGGNLSLGHPRFLAGLN